MNKFKILSIGACVALCLAFVSCGDGICDEQEVDLGLPSGTIWAGWNVGATSPEEYGGYYAWGETEEKRDYSAESYKFSYIESNMYKYENIGTDIAGTQYDVARQKWGGSWRMPTKEELIELHKECEWKSFVYKGVKGYKVTGPNGESMFIPIAGYKKDNLWEKEVGKYWGSTLREGSAGFLSWNMSFGFLFTSYGESSPYMGFSVRPVKSK